MMATRKSTPWLSSLLAVTIVAAASVAHADTIVSYTTTVPMQTTDLSSVTATPAIPEFNTSLGTLNSITISYTGSENSAFTLTNTAAGSETFKFSESLFFELDNTDASIDSDVNGLAPELDNVPLTTITLAHNGTRNFGPFINSNVQSETITGAELADFEGAGNLGDFLISTLTGTTFLGGGGNIKLTGTTTAGGSVEVTYDYTAAPPPPIPEPGTLGLFGTGLLGLAALLRRKYLQGR
jgi:hypothetical protein